MGLERDMKCRKKLNVQAPKACQTITCTVIISLHCHVLRNQECQKYKQHGLGMQMLFFRHAAMLLKVNMLETPGFISALEEGTHTLTLETCNETKVV